ncbi:MAG TPA: DNA helicase UvrD [Verrucomicrobiales bacterium]|nr:DNA helicase UvrD [Verrucomicrobiales bacterium]
MLDLSSLNPPQRDAVKTIHGPVLILAGAGTGKTRVITHRVAHMIRKGIAPDNILAVTFTNKAAKEMQERVGKLIRGQRTDDGDKPLKPTICTFHSLGVRILRRHIERLGYKKNFVIYSESEQQSAMKKILSSLHSNGAKIKPGDVLMWISKHKNAGEQALQRVSEGAEELARHVRARYDSALRACNAVDFDDLLLLTLQLLRGHEDILEDCRRRYRYIMVDEYQDTNAAQFELVNLLAREHRNLCVVGDDDQSIYGWRGAEIANLLDLEKHYPEVKVIKLEQNYRSTSVILNAANAVIKNNARRRGKSLWSDNGYGEPISIASFENEEEEAKSIVENIEFLRMTRKVPWRDHAILVRTNLQTRPLELALRQGKVRYRVVGGQSFFDRREIKDLLAYLKTFLNPHDDVSLLRIANTPARGLSDVTMERLLAASQERHCSVFAAMRHTDVQDGFSDRTKEAIVQFIALLEETRQRLENPPPNVGDRPLQTWCDWWLNDIQYLNDIRRIEKNAEVAENKIMVLRDLIAGMDRSDGGKSTPLEQLEEFLQDISLESDREEEKESAADQVTIITTHSCKGLEWPSVHIAGVEDGLLPHSRSKVEGTLDEERRLFYVAITRAQKYLAMSFCNARRKYGELSPCHPSPFLNELPNDLVKWVDDEPVEKSKGTDLFAGLRAALD